MDDERYLAFRKRAARALHALGQPLPGLGAVAAVLEVSRRAAAAVDAALEGGRVFDRNKYDFLLPRLDELTAFETFSLAEYTYDLPPGRHPGLRLRWDGRSHKRTINLILFEDVQYWRVDSQGDKVAALILSLDVGGQGPRVLAADFSDSFDPLDWQGGLAEAFRQPVLRFGA